MHLRTCLSFIALAGSAAAAPGRLDPAFAPELRAAALPRTVALGSGGEPFLLGGFDRADGAGIGDLLALGEDGSILNPAPGYLSGPGTAALPGMLPLSSFPAVASPFPLEDGSYLLPAESGRWLRMNPDGTVAGPAFTGLAEGEALVPKFERDGKLWVIRLPASGHSSLERRNSSDGTVDPEFSSETDWPDDVLDAVPSALGGAWVLTGDQSTSSGFPLFPGSAVADQHVFLVHGSGAIAGEMRVLSGYRPASLSAAADGGVRIILRPDRQREMYWPAPSSFTYTIQWISPSGELLRSRDFTIQRQRRFTWAEAADGSFLAPGPDGSLQRFNSDGSEDAAFASPGIVNHVAALPVGKWLVDGVRRLDADGAPDESWTVPALDRPARIHELARLPDGRIAVAGDFSTVTGENREGVALFLADGPLDPGFSLDPRVCGVTALAASADSLYAVTKDPVELRPSLRSNVVKLRFDGSLDEDFSPPFGASAAGSISGDGVTVAGVEDVAIFPDGDVLIASVSRMEAASTRISRLNPDGSADASFDALQSYRSQGNAVITEDGGFAQGGIFYRGDGSKRKDINRPGVYLDPLCAWQGGLLFLESRDSRSPRLRLWKGNGWFPHFQPVAIGFGSPVEVATGEKGTLYVHARFGAGDPVLRRLLPAGRFDLSFRAPRFKNRARREAGDWWTAADSGKQNFDPANHESVAGVSALLWQPAGRMLWVGGDFNMADDSARDGLVRIAAGRSQLIRSRR